MKRRFCEHIFSLLILLCSSVRKSLLNVRYLTTLQMVQFVTFFVHACFPLFFECDFPKIFSYVILFHGALFFVLFANFYIQAYIKKGARKAKTTTDINANVKQD